MTTYKAIEMENYKDEPLQFVGVYVLRWRPEWGEPSIGFVTDDETESKLERLQRIEEALRVLAIYTNYATDGTLKDEFGGMHVSDYAAAALEVKGG